MVTYHTLTAKQTSAFNQRLGLPTFNYFEREGHSFGATKQAGFKLDWDKFLGNGNPKRNRQLLASSRMTCALPQIEIYIGTIKRP